MMIIKMGNYLYITINLHRKKADYFVNFDNSKKRG